MRFGAWFRSRPAIGGLLAVLGGLELFFSGQLDVGRIHIQVGIEGLQATVIPLAIVLLGVLATLMPQHRIFYGVILLALALYSLVGVNLGGFVVGMLLSAVGGVLIVAWMPRGAASTATDRGTASSGDAVPRSTTGAEETGASGTGGPASAGVGVARVGSAGVEVASSVAGRSLPEYVAPVSTAASIATLVAERATGASRSDASLATAGSGSGLAPSSS